MVPYLAALSLVDFKKFGLYSYIIMPALAVVLPADLVWNTFTKSQMLDQKHLTKPLQLSTSLRDKGWVQG